MNKEQKINSLVNQFSANIEYIGDYVLYNILVSKLEDELYILDDERLDQLYSDNIGEI